MFEYCHTVGFVFFVRIGEFHLSTYYALCATIICVFYFLFLSSNKIPKHFGSHFRTQQVAPWASLIVCAVQIRLSHH